VRFLRWARPEIISARGFVHCQERPFTKIWTPPCGPGLTGRLQLSGQPGEPGQSNGHADRQINELYRKFQKYFIRPQMTWALLRDTPAAGRRQQWPLRKNLPALF